MVYAGRKVRFEGFDPSVKHDYIHRFLDMDLYVSLHLSGGSKFFPRPFFPEKDFSEDLKRL